MKNLIFLLGMVFVSPLAMAGSSGFASNDKVAEYYIKPNVALISEFLKDNKRNSVPEEFCQVAQQAFYSLDALFLTPNGGEKEQAFARAYHFLEGAQCENGIPEQISFEAEANLLSAFFELNKFWSVSKDNPTAKAPASSEVESAQVQLQN